MHATKMQIARKNIRGQIKGYVENLKSLSIPILLIIRKLFSIGFVRYNNPMIIWKFSFMLFIVIEYVKTDYTDSRG